MTDTNQSRPGETDDEAVAAPPTADESGSDGPTGVSRRTLLVGAAGGSALGIPSRVGGSPSGTVPTGGVAIDGSEAHRRSSAAVAGRVRRELPDVDLTVRRSGTVEGIRRFAAGDVDAAVAGRPMLPAERKRAVEHGVAFERLELALGGAVLAHAGTGWYDCVREPELVEAWSGTGEFETYAELADDESSPESDGRTFGTRRSPNRHRRAAFAPSDDATVLVRGRRSFQYERGRGGVGYYRPDTGDVRPLTEGNRDAADRTRLVRLAFLYLNRDSLERPAVEAFRRAYLDRAARLTGEITYFADPRS